MGGVGILDAFLPAAGALAASVTPAIFIVVGLCHCLQWLELVRISRILGC